MTGGGGRVSIEEEAPEEEVIVPAQRPRVFLKSPAVASQTLARRMCSSKGPGGAAAAAAADKDASLPFVLELAQGASATSLPTPSPQSNKIKI